MIAVILIFGFIALYVIYELYSVDLRTLPVGSWEAMFGVDLKTDLVDRQSEVTEEQFHQLARKYGVTIRE